MKSGRALAQRLLLLLPLHLSHYHAVHSLAVSDVPVASALVHTSIGAVSGCVGALSAYPLDMVKSQLQTDYGREKYGTSGVKAAVDIFRTAGIIGFYRGALVNVMGIAPEKTIKLGVNDFMRGCITSQVGCLPLGGEVVAGGLAGLCQVVATNPLEVIKVRIQTSNDEKTKPLSIVEVFNDVGGFGGLYKGADACAMRDVVFSAFLFPAFAHAKVAVPIYLAAVLGGVEPSHFLSNLLAGSVAAAPAAFIATPADVVKTRLQQARGAGNIVEDMNTFDMAKSIVDAEGLQVLFSGWFERVIRSIPQFGVTLSLFDILSTKAAEAGVM
mmetsp:Transcript_11156/g.23517  ORF Transcript_11156/g.23517 Transcript_11156/m.23517 type:complete len:327 (+) Transcript_11156:559-1539(+)